MKLNLIIFYSLVILLVIVRLYLFYSTQPQFSDGQYVSFNATIDSQPKAYQSYQTLFTNLSPTTGVLLKLPLDTEFSYGDKVLFSGRLNYQLLKSGDSIFTMDYPKTELNTREINPALAVIYSIRQKIIDFFQQKLDRSSAGLILGIVFGIKENMSKDFLDQIQQTGVTHVIAASGMNVTMVSGFLFYLFIVFFKRQVAIALSIAGIIFYVALSGFEASIIRAAIMGIIVFSAQVLGRQKLSSHTLFLTIAIMLLVWPEFLFSIGFQLSIAATCGILYIPPLFKRFTNRFSEVFIITISAQVATLPILITNFGNYSALSIITNAAVLWTVPILMILGMIAAILVFVFEPLATLILYLCLPFLLYFEKTVAFFASFGAILSLPAPRWQFSVAYYLTLAAVAAYFYEKISASRDS